MSNLYVCDWPHVASTVMKEIVIPIIFYMFNLNEHLT